MSGVRQQNLIFIQAGQNWHGLTSESEEADLDPMEERTPEHQLAATFSSGETYGKTPELMQETLSGPRLPP